MLNKNNDIQTTRYRVLGAMLLILLFACSPEVPDSQTISLEWTLVPSPYATHTINSSNSTIINVQKQIFSQKASLQNKPLINADNFPRDLQLSFLHDEPNYADIILSDKNNTLYADTYFHPEVKGLCLEPLTGLPTFFIGSHEEGIGGFKHEIIRQSEQGKWQSWRLRRMVNTEETDTLIDPFIQCSELQESHWDSYITNNNVQPCKCQFPDAVFQPTDAERWDNAIDVEYVTKAQFNEHFENTELVPLNLLPLTNQQEISQLITYALNNPDYLVTDITIDAHRFVNVVMEYEIYQHVGLSFIQKNNEWYLWYKAGDNSKGFHPVIFNGQAPNGQLQLQLCIDECDWWGQQANVELNLAELTVRFIDRDV